MVDIPGVNAQEQMREKLVESLCLVEEDMLKNGCDIHEGAQLETIEV